jgi:hypothetical protein
VAGKHFSFFIIRKIISFTYQKNTCVVSFSCDQWQDHMHLIHTPYPNKSTLAKTHALFYFSFLLIEKLYFAPCCVLEIQFSSLFIIIITTALFLLFFLFFFSLFLNGISFSLFFHFFLFPSALVITNRIVKILFIWKKTYFKLLKLKKKY